MQRLEQFKQVIADSLSLTTPDGFSLMEGIEFHCPAGSWSRLSGRSGLRKSTLLRTLNGVWPWFAGSWEQPRGNAMLLPQKSYLGYGTLAEILCYPSPRRSDK